MPEPINNTTPPITLVEEDCSYNCPVCHRGEALSEDEWCHTEDTEEQGEELEAVSNLVFVDNYTAARDAIGATVASSAAYEWPFDSALLDPFSHPLAAARLRSWARDEEVILENCNEPNTPLLTYDP